MSAARSGSASAARPSPNASRNLEAIAGRPLLERGGQGVRLTDAGAQLVSATPPIFHERDVLLATLDEVNDASCRFVTRPRHELLGLAGDTAGIWCKGSEQSEAIERIARGGAEERSIVDVRQPDGTLASESACARLIGSAEPPMLVLVVDERPDRQAPASG
jgi:hypothetical protein